MRAESRKKILRAAAKLFLRHGFEKTTVQDIVKAAGTSIGNVYFYFANKEALIAELLEEAATSAWRWTDEAIVGVPRGPARLAVMVLANQTALLGPTAGLTRILALDPHAAHVRERMIQRYADRVRTFILDNLPSVASDRLDLTVTAWIGAGLHCVEQKLAGHLADTPDAIGTFLVRWNLRAVGVSEAEIDEAIAIAARVVGERNDNAGRARHRTPRGQALTRATSRS